MSYMMSESNYHVETYCPAIKRTADEEGDFESPIIVSGIKIHVKRKGKKEQVPVKLITQLSDFETLDIIGTKSETELQ